jgi:hypothetical protein
MLTDLQIVGTAGKAGGLISPKRELLLPKGALLKSHITIAS